MVFSFAPNVLISHLKAALRFVSSDEARPDISCLRLEAHGKEVRFLATDGFRLWVAAVDANEEAGVGFVHVARADAMRLMSKVIDKKSGTVRLVFNPADGVITVGQGTHVSSFAAVDLEKLEKTYPSFAHVFEKMVPAETPRVAVSVNGAYLADAAASFADVRPKTKSDDERTSSLYILPGSSAFAPVTISERGTPAVMLIMPTQSDAYDAATSYVTDLTERFSSAPVPPRRKRAG